MTDRKIIALNDLPYTIIGHTSPTPLLRIVLTAKGVKAIASQLQDSDCVVIQCWADFKNKEAVAHYSDISIHREVSNGEGTSPA